MLIYIVFIISFRPKPVGIEVNTQFTNFTYIIPVGGINLS